MKMVGQNLFHLNLNLQLPYLSSLKKKKIGCPDAAQKLLISNHNHVMKMGLIPSFFLKNKSLKLKLFSWMCWDSGVPPPQGNPAVKQVESRKNWSLASLDLGPTSQNGKKCSVNLPGFQPRSSPSFPYPFPRNFSPAIFIHCEQWITLGHAIFDQPGQESVEPPSPTHVGMCLGVGGPCLF